MLKGFLKHQMPITLSIWAFCWICRCFILWQIKNPFEWIINVPTYSIEARGSILFCLLTYYGSSFAYWDTMIYKPTKTTT